MDERLQIPCLVAVVATMLSMTGVSRADSMDGTYGDRDLEVRLRVSHLGIRTADRVAVILEARAPEGNVLVMPDFTGRLGDFRVRDARPGRLRMDPEAGSVEQVASWVLEPYLPGTYEIPALVVSSRPGEGREGEARSVETPPVSVQVNSIFPAAEAEAPSLRDAAEPMREHTPWLPIVIFLLLAPLGVKIVLRLLGRERVGTPLEGDPSEAADVAALAALDGVEEDGDGGGLQEVLNGYLQKRFHQRTRGRSLEEVSRKLALEERAAAIFTGLVDQLHRARYGRADQAEGAATMARSLLEEFIRETGLNEGGEAS